MSEDERAAIIGRLKIEQLANAEEIRLLSSKLQTVASQLGTMANTAQNAGSVAEFKASIFEGGATACREFDTEAAAQLFEDLSRAKQTRDRIRIDLGPHA